MTCGLSFPSSNQRNICACAARAFDAEGTSVALQTEQSSQRLAVLIEHDDAALLQPLKRGQHVLHLLRRRHREDVRTGERHSGCGVVTRLRKVMALKHATETRPFGKEQRAERRREEPGRQPAVAPRVACAKARRSPHLY